MRDQLSLRLEPDVPVLPNLPATLRPMLPRPIAEPFDSDAHLFEPSWGGMRALAFIGPAEVAGSGDVTFVDGAGRESAGAAGARGAGGPGRRPLGGARRRARGRRRERPGRRRRAGATAGRRARPAGRLPRVRPARTSTGGRCFGAARPAPGDLRKVLRPGDEVVAVPAIAGEGRALHEAAAAQGIAGVMARQRSRPYLPGRQEPALAVHPDARPGRRDAADRASAERSRRSRPRRPRRSWR